MKLKTLALLIFATCLCGGAIAWLYFDGSRPDAIPLGTRDATPGRLFAYDLTLPFKVDNSIALEIRRLSTPNSQEHTDGSVSGNLRVSSEEAEMIVSTSLISSPKSPDQILVSVCLLDVNDILEDPTGFGEWVVAGRLKISGVSSKLMPKEKFCVGGSISTVWERNPSWQDNEICVGRFRSHDENRIYDYYCVVFAKNQKLR
jgi:hypothetical protein